MKRPVLAWLLLAIFLLGQSSALAHPLQPVGSMPNVASGTFNLHSTQTTASAGSLGDAATFSIRVGHQSMMVNANTDLTPAEQVALEEVMSSGIQSLIVNKYGSAVGGSFSFASLPLQALEGLLIPRGVTAIDNLSGGNSWDFSGNLVNAGDLLVVSTAPAINSGKFSALNIYNLSGGLISTAGKTPASQNGTSKIAGQKFAVDLSLNAIDDLVNFGTIAGSGNLSIAAGGSITNGGLAKSDNMPTITANHDINMVAGSGNVTNAGLISSVAGDINFSAPQSIDLIFSNSGGTVAAPSGNINFRDPNYNGAFNLTVSGGNFAANAVNIYSGQGDVNVTVDQLQGVVNVSAQCAHITAATNVLDLGNMDITGDPTFYNTTGDVLISGDLIFPGQSLAIVAEGNIETTAGAGIIDTSSSTGNGGSILMVAGASFTATGGNASVINATSGDADNNAVLTITGGSASGGTIDLTQSGGITGINSYSSAANGYGGSVQFIAYAGSDANSGNILLPAKASIVTGGSGTGQGGNVSIIAGGPDATISVGAINTLGGVGAGGNVSIATATPVIDSFGSCSACVVMIEGGAVDSCFPCSGTFQTSYSFDSCTCSEVQSTSWVLNSVTGFFTFAGLATAGSIRTGNIGGSSVSIVSGGNLLVDGSITASAGENSYTGGSVGLTSSSSSAFVVGGATVNGVVGTITVGSATVTNGSGGGVYIANVQSTAGGGITISSWQNLSIQTPAAGLQVAGGSVSLYAASGALLLPQGNLSVDGVAGGQGGWINMTADTITVQGANGQTATQALYLSANGNGGGYGGHVEITVNTGNLSIGRDPGQIAISAQAGTNAVPYSISYAGEGGYISVLTAGNLSVDAGSLLAGSAPQITLSAGTKGPGTLFVNGNLCADAASGSGGTIILSSNSASPFVIGGATANGVTGMVSANASATVSGFGGSITITNNGTGGIDVSNPAYLSVQASGAGGGGGSISLNAANGTLTIAQGVLSVDAHGTIAPPADNNGLCCNGGSITLVATTLNIEGANGGAATGSLNLSALGSSQGVGGSIYIYQNVGDLRIGSGPGQISISAQDKTSLGADYLSSNNPTTIRIATGGNLTVDATALAAGDAPSIYLVAGVQGQGNLLIQGSLTANGIAGSAGTIILAANSSQPFVIGAATANGITGAILANGSFSSTGSGGSISVYNMGSGGITVSDSDKLSASASANGGSGGSIILNAGNGALTISQGTLSVDGVSPASGSNADMPSAGGNIILQGSQIVVTASGGGQATGTLALSANGSGSGNAGSVSLVTQSGDLTIGSQAGQITISAQGGSAYSSGAPPSPTCEPIDAICCLASSCCSSGEEIYTGKVFVSAGGNLTVDPLALVVGPASGTSANGADIILVAGAGTYNGSLLVSGSVSANGSGNGWGGRIVLGSASSDVFVVSANATGITNGVEGTVSATGENGGTIILAAGGTISVDPGALNASAPQVATSTTVTVTQSPNIVETPEYVPQSDENVAGDGLTGSITIIGDVSSTGSVGLADASVSPAVTIVASACTVVATDGLMEPNIASCCSNSVPNPNGSIIQVTFIQALDQGYLCCAGPQTNPNVVSLAGWNVGFLGFLGFPVLPGFPGAITAVSLSVAGTVNTVSSNSPSNPPSTSSPVRSSPQKDPLVPTVVSLSNAIVTSSASGSYRFLPTATGMDSVASSLASLFSESANSRPSLNLGSEPGYNTEVMIMTEGTTTPDSLPLVTQPADGMLVDTGDAEP